MKWQKMTKMTGMTGMSKLSKLSDSHMENGQISGLSWDTQPRPLLCWSARLKRGELMTLMGRLEPESAAIFKNVKTIQIRADLTKLWRICLSSCQFHWFFLANWVNSKSAVVQKSYIYLSLFPLNILYTCLNLFPLM